MNELATIREREEIESRPILEGFEGGWRAIEASGVGMLRHLGNPSDVDRLRSLCIVPDPKVRLHLPP